MLECQFCGYGGFIYGGRLSDIFKSAQEGCYTCNILKQCVHEYIDLEEDIHGYSYHISGPSWSGGRYVELKIWDWKVTIMVHRIPGKGVTFTTYILYDTVPQTNEDR